MHSRLYLEGNRFTIQMDHKELRWILTMTEATEKLARCRSRLSECEFVIVDCAGTKQQAVDARSRGNTKGEGKRTLNDEVPVFAAPQAFQVCLPQTKITDFETIKRPKGPFVRFIPEVCIIADIKDNEKPEIPTFAEFISVLSTVVDCSSVLESIGKPNTRFNLKGDGVLLQLSPLDRASQRVGPAYVRSGFLHLRQYSLFASHSGERLMYDSMRK